MIRGVRCNVRAVERGDARFLRDLLNSPSVQAGWGISGVPVSIHRVEADIERWIERERIDGYPMGLIVESLDGEPVGLVVVECPDRPKGSLATISLAIETESQGQGYGRDALTAVIEALFDEWRVHRIELTCEADNGSAAALYRSVGFTLEATHTGATFTGGEWRDPHLFALLATDPRPWLE